MSSRQKNKAKRMAKLFAKQRSRDAVETNEKRYNRPGLLLFQLSWDCDLISVEKPPTVCACILIFYVLIVLMVKSLCAVLQLH